jgi:hypothetical protein
MPDATALLGWCATHPFLCGRTEKGHKKGGDATALVWKSPALEKNNNPAFRVKMTDIPYFRGIVRLATFNTFSHGFYAFYAKVGGPQIANSQTCRLK